MSSAAWRAVGINYVRYSAICARAVRNSLKPELKAEATKRDASLIKTTHWQEGKPVAEGQAKSATG